MLTTFDAMTNSDMLGVFCPVRSLLDLLPVGAGSPIVLAATVTAAAAALILAAARGRAAPATAAASGPGGVMTREEALGHVRRVRAELKGRKGEASVAEVLARAGLPALHDVVLIVVLETKTFAGVVTGGVRDRHWVQHLRDGAVLQNYRHVRAVREVAGAGVPMAGLVVSAGAGRFSGELEFAVVRVADLAARLCFLQTTVDGCGPVRLDAAWARLIAAAAYGVELRGAHGEQMRRRRGETR